MLERVYQHALAGRMVERALETGATLATIEEAVERVQRERARSGAAEGPE